MVKCDEYVNPLIALGANLDGPAGRPAASLIAALDQIAALPGVTLHAVSRFWRSPAWPIGAGPDFVNAACAVTTTLPASRLLEALHRIEADLGRVRQHRWGARAVDLDLIAYGAALLPDAATAAHWRDLPPEAQTQETPDRLILPHPRMQDRGFVLLPLAEIAADWRHPALGASVAELAARLSDAARQGLEPFQP
ncbi:MAG: 2-amino-4-hydroxy-6-hydroxymethyldihydropteridine diphosphokinase [Paracoccus sp. (in: a-proteobacteria)]|uniref:2-amino-4-hydroxy-6- hydroxymethyldihydropteridine diphosphokinase n=1 Tax=Paracoccus sp. TaxID=267 RepID=UPI0026E05ADC|nr:2-amino-4-hydroxy-6-hydroxymethyldihydropteridine diphosphokinase [Paracoccus sp. (in: a-proteobacteria)]MDO5622463.1 2-amino-4-hydroxy-6-hydroxymethyldihydropteridine diphosphokinase [Paracoccus sp. (in: a-proteobacteria)]